MLLGSGVYYLIGLGNSLEMCVRNLQIAHVFFTSSQDRVKSTKRLLPLGITEKKSQSLHASSKEFPDLQAQLMTLQ